MKKTRIKSVRPLISTREQAERVLGELAGLAIQRDAHVNEMNAAIVAIREAHEEPLAAIAKQMDEKTELLRGWAESNPEEFGKRKSIDMTHGTLGFRTGTPKLKTIAGWTWARVLDALRASIEDNWLRTKVEVDKERMLADHAAGTASDAVLKSYGVKVVQDEAFFVEPKLEVTQEAA